METNAILILAAAIAAVTSSILYILYTLRQRKIRKQQLITNLITIDDERKRIMSDLHDELGPLLSIVKMQVMHLQTKIDSEPVAGVVQNIDHLMSRMRNICNQPVTDSVIKKDFRETLAGFISDLRKYSGLQVYLATDREIHLPDNIQIQLYRVIQEIVNNTIKHANATVLTISIRVQSRNHLQISIADNGRGFQTEKFKNCSKGGMGMRNIFSRISMLNGMVFIDSTQGEGTKYTIKVPCAPALCLKLGALILLVP